MKGDATALLAMAERAIKAAQYLLDGGFAGDAASRAYYAMFYAASAALISKGLEFKTHAALHSAFGTEFARNGILPTEFHRWMLDAAEARLDADYFTEQAVTMTEAMEHIRRATVILHGVRSFLKRP